MNGKKEQIQKSKEKIVEATFKLLENDDFDQLTLNEILDESKVSKRTFYRYFKNKQAILDYYFDEFINYFFSLEEFTLKLMSLEELLLVTLDYFEVNKDKLRILIINQKFYQLIHKFNNMATTIHAHITTSWYNEDVSTEQIWDFHYFIVGAYSNIISHWLMEEHPRSAHEIAINVRQLVKQLAKTFDLH